jgi:hypothetical protein
LGPCSGGGPVGLADGGTDGTGSLGSGVKRVASDTTVNGDAEFIIVFVMARDRAFSN